MSSLDPTVPASDRLVAPPIIESISELDDAALDAAIECLEAFVAPHLITLKRLRKRRATKKAAIASAKARAARLPAETVERDRKDFDGDRGHITHLAEIHRVSKRTVHRKLTGK
jgi:multidrug resistance efflux pump